METIQSKIHQLQDNVNELSTQITKLEKEFKSWDKQNPKSISNSETNKFRTELIELISGLQNSMSCQEQRINVFKSFI